MKKSPTGVLVDLDYHSKEYSEEVANWCQDFYTVARGRMCLVYSRYAGCNKNMGEEVSWGDIKSICSFMDALGVFM